MPDLKRDVLEQLGERFGAGHKLAASNSLFEFSTPAPLRIYFRYSKVHGRKTFYGLRQTDLQRLEGVTAVVCFLWDSQAEPLFIPYQEYEEVFRDAVPAADGQYKVQLYPSSESVELNVPRMGRFNVEGHMGWQSLIESISHDPNEMIPSLTHSQVQTILGAIGNCKGCDVWIPPNNRLLLDVSLAAGIQFREQLPTALTSISQYLAEVDAIWIERGSGKLRSLFEVEHSTPIYSGLLRFNDFYLSAPTSNARFTVVSNEERRAIFARQLNRPTFTASGLSERCGFLPYSDVYRWYRRVTEVNAASR